MNTNPTALPLLVSGHTNLVNTLRHPLPVWVAEHPKPGCGPPLQTSWFYTGIESSQAVPTQTAGGSCRFCMASRPRCSGTYPTRRAVGWRSSRRPGLDELRTRSPPIAAVGPEGSLPVVDERRALVRLTPCHSRPGWMALTSILSGVRAPWSLSALSSPASRSSDWRPTGVDCSEAGALAAVSRLVRGVSRRRVDGADGTVGRAGSRRSTGRGSGPGVVVWSVVTRQIGSTHRAWSARPGRRSPGD